MKYAPYPVSSELKNSLLARFHQLPEVTSLKDDVSYFSLLVSLGIHQEIGTIHDELAVFLYDPETGRRIPKNLFRSEIIRAKHGGEQAVYGVRIWAEGVKEIDPRVRGLKTLTHPTLSYDAKGKLNQLVFFPSIIIEIAALQGAELVSVKPWGLNTIFGGFDERRSYYEANLWELVNIDVLRYAKLLESRQIVFWGTHDLVAHIAGSNQDAWPELETRGRSVRILMEDYFSNLPKPVPAALILPYTLGLLLDDLAQPRNYESQSRKEVIALLSEALSSKVIPPATQQYLLRYPPSMSKLIALARSNDSKKIASHANELVNTVISEISKYSVQLNA